MDKHIRENIFTPKTILLTGSTGVIGSSIKDYFAKYFPEIGVLPLFTPFSLQNLHDRLKSEPIDYFINAAGSPSNDFSRDEPYQTFDVNSVGVLKQLEIIRKFSPKTKYITFGSIYEEVYDTPYAISKRISREIVKTYRENYNLFCVQATLGFTEYYNRTEKFITRKISKKVAEIYHKTKNIESFTALEIENPYDIFHFTWGRDVANGVWKMLEQDKPKDYTIINKKNCSLLEFAQAAFYGAALEHNISTKQNYERLPVPDFNINNVPFWIPIHSYKDIAIMMVDWDIKNYKP